MFPTSLTTHHLYFHRISGEVLDLCQNPERNAVQYVKVLHITNMYVSESKNEKQKSY